MIRIETDAGWILVEHREHALLAGRFARHWGNAEFAAPEPRADILAAVDRHDDAWTELDAVPFLTREGRPGAFSRELVGKYAAFEEIELAGYLGVRDRAADAVAADNPFAAIVISMHTVNLLTERADLAGLSESDRALHRAFIERQLGLQAKLIGALAGGPNAGGDLAARLHRAFEFLQACDSLSLTVCVRYPEPISLRHRHPKRDGTSAQLVCTPLGDDTYRIAPWPLDAGELGLETPCRHVKGKVFANEAAFRAAFAAAPVGRLKVRIVS
jgi:Protein of unknown function (DUF3891)